MQTDLYVSFWGKLHKMFGGGVEKYPQSVSQFNGFLPGGFIFMGWFNTTPLRGVLFLSDCAKHLR